MTFREQWIGIEDKAGAKFRVEEGRRNLGWRRDGPGVLMSKESPGDNEGSELKERILAPKSSCDFKAQIKKNPLLSQTQKSEDQNPVCAWEWNSAEDETSARPRSQANSLREKPRKAGKR